MNIFRFAGDMSHLLSIMVLLLKIRATKSCRGEVDPQVEERGRTRSCCCNGRRDRGLFAMCGAGVPPISSTPSRFSMRCRHFAQDTGAVCTCVYLPLP